MRSTRHLSAVLTILLAGCGGSGASGSAPGDGDGGMDGGASFYEEVQGWVAAYRAAHPGNGGKDWDINARSDAEIAADPAAQRLLALCPGDQRPVIPLLAWEYGGNDHSWITPEASALVYCVYIPVNPATDHWTYDGGLDQVTADSYVLFPEHNPCKDSVGAGQVADCIGSESNFEILVDNASRNDGMDVGLDLAESSTNLMLILGDGSKVLLVYNP